jgi:hypothetical protein
MTTVTRRISRRQPDSIRVDRAISAEPTPIPGTSSKAFDKAALEGRFAFGDGGARFAFGDGGARFAFGDGGARFAFGDSGARFAFGDGGARFAFGAGRTRLG